MRQFTCGFIVVLLIAALTLTASPVQAVDVSGSIAENTTWTVDNSPYNVMGDILVEDGVTLTIEPGVLVQFQGPYQFNVDGRLLAIGSIRTGDNRQPDERLEPWNSDDVQWIVFTQDTTGIGDTDPADWAEANADNLWKGIRFNDSNNGSRIQWAVIQFGYARGAWPNNNGGGIYVRATSVNMQNLIIQYNRADQFGGGVYLWSTASMFRNNLLVDNFAGVSGGGVYVDQSTTQFVNLTMVGNEADTYGNAIYFGPDAAMTVRSTIFENNPTDGNNDDPYFPETGPDVRFSINSALDDYDPARVIYPGPSYFAEETFFTLADSSDAIDQGWPDDNRWVNEPLPNAGPLGDRINMGVWGGTPLTAKSLPVAKIPKSSHVFTVAAETRIGSSREITLTIENIGAGVLQIRHENISILDHLPDREYDDDFTPAEIAEFQDDWFIPEFDRFNLLPDSVGGIAVIYQPDENIMAEIPIGTSVVYRDWLGVLLETNDDALRYEVRGVAIDPVLEADTTQIEFGEVHFGSPDTAYVEVSNTGTTDLEGIAVNFTNSNFAWFSDSTYLAPGNSMEIGIVAQPVSTGPINGIANIRSNGGTAAVPLTGSGVGPIPFLPEYYTSTPDSNYLYFAYVDVEGDDSITRLIEVKNDGNLPLTLEAEFTEPSFSLEDEYVNSQGETVEFILPAQPGQTVFVPIRFDPQEERTYLDTLTLTITDTLDEHLTVREFVYELRGRGTAGGRFFSGEIPNPANNISNVWGANGDSIYIAAGPATIPPGKKLSILPGVKVYFESPDVDAGASSMPSFIRVEGTLEAVGSEDGKIMFAPLPNQIGQSGEIIHSRFGGLRFLASEAGTRLEHVIIDSARTLAFAEMAEAEGLDTTGTDPFVENVPHVLGHGGGISIYNSSPILHDVEVRNCISYQDGGGIWTYQGAPTLIRVNVHNNAALGTNLKGVAEGHGGGMVFWGSRPGLHANLIHENEAAIDGGGLYMLSLTGGRYTNSIIMNNTAAGLGAGAYITAQSSPILLNDVFIDNEASDPNELVINGQSNPVIRNSVVWGDPSGSINSTDAPQTVVTHSFVRGGFDSGIQIYAAMPEFAEDDASLFDYFKPSGEGSNLVDAGTTQSQFQDYTFPPSLGDVTTDIGITGGPYASYWGAPLRINLFRNPANARGMKVIVNAVEPIESAPTFEVSDYSGSEELDLTEISAQGRVWETNYVVDASTILTFTASAPWVNNEGQTVTASTRREVTVTVYTQSQGASIASAGGASLTVPPYSGGDDKLLMAYGEIGAELPEQVNGAVRAGERWTIDAGGLVWSQQAEIELPYDGSVVVEGHESGVSVWRRSGNEWSRLDSYVDPDSRTVVAETNTGGTFIVLYEHGESVSSLLPESSQLGANYPNPFNPTTTIPFTLNHAGNVRLGVYNVLGRKVATIVNQRYTTGAHVVVWNGRDDAGQPVASGVYFYRMETQPANGDAGVAQTRKLVLMR